MIVPIRHVATPGELDAAERAELWELLDRSLAAIECGARRAGPQRRLQPRRRRRRGHRRPPAPARRAALVGRLQLHARARRHPRDAAVPRRDARGARRGVADDGSTIGRMTLDPSVFKAYDVRGIVPDELDADGVYRIVRAYVDEFEPRTMAIGRDMRLTSPELCEAAVRGALDAGSDVDDIGLVGTEMLYYAVCEHGYEGGLIVTASHNPKQYNGMKIVRRGALPLGGDGGIEKVRDRALAGEFRTPDGAGEARTARRAAGLRRALPLDRRRRRDRAAAGRARRRQRHGRDDDGADPRAPAAAAPSAATSTPTARSRTTSRTRCSRRTASSSSARSSAPAPTSASPGTATPTAASSSTTPASSCRATSSPRSWPSRCSPSTPARRSSTTCAPRAPCPTSSSAPGGTAIASRVGHAFIKHRMRKENALFAGEVSGHYYFRDFYGVDTGHRAGARRARARLALGQAALRAARAAARALPPLGRDQLDRRATCRSSCRS